MTEQEAIEWQKAFKKTYRSMPKDSDIACDMAISALEKQIQKKPIIHTNDKDRLACCPVCDSNVDWTYEGFWRKGNPKYCRECGQAIDWSDTN